MTVSEDEIVRTELFSHFALLLLHGIERLTNDVYSQTVNCRNGAGANHSYIPLLDPSKASERQGGGGLHGRERDAGT